MTRQRCSAGRFSLGTNSPLSVSGLSCNLSTRTMSYVQAHLSTEVSSPSNTSRPTPAPPLKSVTGDIDRAADGSAMGVLRPLATASIHARSATILSMVSVFLGVDFRDTLSGFDDREIAEQLARPDKVLQDYRSRFGEH